MGREESPSTQFAGFLRKYSRSVTADARATLTRLRERIPGAVEMVYDTYNGLVIGFGPTERASQGIVSLTIFPRWVTLCFIQNGPDIPDPGGLLKGTGNVVRHVRLQSAKDLDKPQIRALLGHALRLADVRIDTAGRRRMVIKSISAKQRPRRR